MAYGAGGRPREVEDAHTLERAAWDRRGFSACCANPLALPSAGADPIATGVGGEAIGRPGHEHPPTATVVDFAEEPPMLELFRRDEIVWLRVRTHRAAERRQDAHDVGLVALLAPLLQCGRGEWHVVGAGGSGRDPLVGEPVGVGRRGQRVPLRRHHPDELHPTVATAHHPHEAVATALTPQDDTVVVEPAQSRAVERELRLLDRDVDLLAASRAQPVVHRAEHRDRGVPTRVVLRQIRARLDRRPLGELLPARATGQDRTLTAGVERHEMMRPIPAYGPVSPKGVIATTIVSSSSASPNERSSRRSVTTTSLAAASRRRSSRPLGPSSTTTLAFPLLR